MKYPTKIHTRAVSGAYFVHVLALFLFSIHEPIATALVEIEIDFLLDFLAEDINELMDNLTYADTYLNSKEKRMLKNIHDWLIWENMNRPGIDFGS